MNDENRIASGVFWKLGEKLFAKGIAFVISMALARILDPDHYGILTIVLVFINLADVFVVSGFSTSLIQKKDADQRDFSTIFYCSLAVSVLIYLIMFFASPLIASFYDEPLLIPVLRVFSLKIPLSVLNSIQHAYVSRHMLFKKFFFSTSIGTLISGILGIMAARRGLGAWALVIQNLSNMTIDSVVLLITVPWRPTLEFSWDSAKTLMSYGWKILAADFSGNFFGQLRTLIIGKVYTQADLAYYDRGQQISSLISSNLSPAVSEVMFPALANHSDDQERIRELLRTAVRVMAFIFFPVMGGIMAVAEPMILCILTEKWEQSIPFIQILSVGYAFGVIGSLLLQAIKAIGRSDVVLRAEFIKKPLYLVLLIYGVRKSVIWVAITMAMYDVLGTLYNMVIVKKYAGYSYPQQWQDNGVYLIMSTVMALAVYFFNLPVNSRLVILISKIALGVLLYVAMTLIIKPQAYRDVMEKVKNLKRS